ncbi:MAG: maltose O-acetyltransferase [Candidatus Moranbacteria bacterium]|nr:maltose O-acetyltransferase [Candidatus Moranbacteria bacterium]
MKNIIIKVGIRLKLWKMIFNHIGKKTIIAKTIIVYSPENISIGNNTIINEYVMLNARTNINIGNDVHISPFVIINTGGLDYDKTMEERKHIEKPVTIEDGVWIGSGAIINPGINIGENTVVGAGAVVTTDLPSNSVAVGVPAKVIKEIKK